MDFFSFSDPFSREKEVIQENLQELESCIRTDKDMKLVVIALSAIKHHGDIPIELPEELKQKILPIQKLYNDSNLQLSEERIKQFDELFCKAIQEKIDAWETPFSEESDFSLQSIISVAESLFTENMNGKERSDLIKDLVEVAETLSATDSSLEAVLALAKSFFTENMNGKEKGILVKDLATAAKILFAEDIPLEVVIDLAEPFFAENMNGPEKGELIKDLATAAKMLSATDSSLEAVLGLAKSFFTENMNGPEKGELIKDLAMVAKMLSATDITLEFVLDFTKPFFSENMNGSEKVELIKDLLDVEQTLSTTDIALEVVMDLAKPLFTENMNGSDRGNLVKSLTKDLLDAEQMLSTTDVELEVVIDLAKPHFAENMNGSDRVNIVKSLVEDLVEAAQMLCTTGIELEVVINLAKPHFAGNMSGSDKGNLIKSLAEDLADTAQMLCITDISVEVVLDLAKPLFTEDMNGSSRCNLIKSLAEIAIKLSALLPTKKNKDKLSREEFVECFIENVSKFKKTSLSANSPLKIVIDLAKALFAENMRVEDRDYIKSFPFNLIQILMSKEISVQKTLLKMIAKLDVQLLPEGLKECELFISVLEELDQKQDSEQISRELIEKNFHGKITELLGSDLNNLEAFFIEYRNNPLYLSVAYRILSEKGMTLDGERRQIVMQSREFFLKMRAGLKEKAFLLDKEIAVLTDADRKRVLSDSCLQEFKQNWKQSTGFFSSQKECLKIEEKYRESSLKYGKFVDIEYGDLLGDGPVIYMPGMALLASYIAQKEKIEGLLVCENARALRSEIQKIKDNPKDQRKALIIGSIMLNPESNDPLHKAVVCVEKKDGVISLIIIDSIGNAIPEWTYAVVDKLSPIFSEDCWLYMSEVGRQRSQRGCPVFAFQDAIAFLQDKDFLQRVTYKEEMSEHVKKIIELPPRFMIMAQSLTQLEEYKEKHPTAFEDQKKGKSLDTTLQKHRVSREENEGEEENRYVARKYLKLLHLIDSCLENLPPAQVQAMINSHLITSS